MIEPQQILYKAKGSKKVFKSKPYYELIDYEEIMFSKEKELYEAKFTSEQEYLDSFIDPELIFSNGKKYIYLAIDIITRKEYRSLSSTRLCEYIDIPHYAFLKACKDKSFIKTWICSREVLRK